MNVIERTVARLVYMAIYLLGIFPPRVFRNIAGVIGIVWYCVDVRHRKVAVTNMTRAFEGEMTDADIKRHVKEHFRQLSQMIFEIGWSLHLSDNDIKRYVTLDGVEHLDRAFKEQKGVLLLTGHIGSWELLTLVPALLNPSYTFHDIYRPLDYPPLERVVTHIRTRFGMKLIPKDNAMIKIFKALKRGEGVGIPFDQSVVNPSNSINAPFFGRKTSTSKGLAQIALRTGAPVVAVFMVRQKEGYSVRFSKKVTLIRSGDEGADIRANTERFNAVIEECIRHYPSQWFWVHNRWKRTLPEPDDCVVAVSG